MIFLVTNIDESQRIRADSPRIVELSIRGSLASKSSEEVTAGVENLNPVIISVSYDELTNSVDRDSGKTVEFSLPVSISSEPEPVLSLLVEYLDSVVGGVRHDDGVVWSNSNTSRPCKKSGLAPPSAEFKYQGLFLKVLIFRHTTYPCGALRGLCWYRSGGACRVF